MNRIILATVALLFLSTLGLHQASGKPEVKSQRIDATGVLHVKLTGINGPDFPERVQARVDGRELDQLKLQFSRPTLAILVDTSVGCQIAGIAKPLKKHLVDIVTMLPPESSITLMTYDSASVKVVSEAARTDQFSVEALTCGSKRSISLGDVILKIFEEGKRFDMLVAYTSGNIYLDEKRAKAMNSVTVLPVVVSYLTPRTDLGEHASEILHILRSGKEPNAQWLKTVAAKILGRFALNADLSVPLPAELSSGNYNLDVDFIRGGKPISTTIVRFKYESKSKIKGFGLPIWILLITCGLLLIIGIYGYYRTPRCRKCKRSMLRKYRACFYCLQYSDAIIEIQSANETKLFVLRNHVVIGSDRSADIRLPGQSKGESFVIERDAATYYLITNNKDLLLNGRTIQGPRHLRSGDRVSFGGMTCRLYIQKKAA